jgi:hypothetical protein
MFIGVGGKSPIRENRRSLTFDSPEISQMFQISKISANFTNISFPSVTKRHNKTFPTFLVTTKSSKAKLKNRKKNKFHYNLLVLFLAGKWKL